MTIAGGIALLVVGAILTFALTTESFRGIDLHVVGVILIGTAGFLPTLLAGNGPRPNQVAEHLSPDRLGEVVADAETAVKLSRAGLRVLHRGPDRGQRMFLAFDRGDGLPDEVTLRCSS
ncbi:MAG: hypothetical protein QOE54_3993 [Streptosporangiaceae bacterium]|jgi:hypothetical protein|nr:hypothetical protein [Streptosporangiaceae bacterium]